MKFKPVVGKENDTLTITVGSMLNPSFKSEISYGNNQSIFFLKAEKVICKKETGGNVLITDKFDNRNVLNEDEKNSVLSISEDGEISNNITIRNNKINCNINLYGEENCREYIVSAYINHKIVPLFSGQNYTKIKTTKDKVSTIKIDYDLSDFVLEDLNGFYVTCIAVNGSDRSYKSDTVVLQKA